MCVCDETPVGAARTYSWVGARRVGPLGPPGHFPGLGPAVGVVSFRGQPPHFMFMNMGKKRKKTSPESDTGDRREGGIVPAPPSSSSNDGPLGELGASSSGEGAIASWIREKRRRWCRSRGVEEEADTPWLPPVIKGMEFQEHPEDEETRDSILRGVVAFLEKAEADEIVLDEGAMLWLLKLANVDPSTMDLPFQLFVEAVFLLIRRKEELRDERDVEVEREMKEWKEKERARMRRRLNEKVRELEEENGKKFEEAFQSEWGRMEAELTRVDAALEAAEKGNRQEVERLLGSDRWDDPRIIHRNMGTNTVAAALCNVGTLTDSSMEVDVERMDSSTQAGSLNESRETGVQVGGGVGTREIGIQAGRKAKTKEVGIQVGGGTLEAGETGGRGGSSPGMGARVEALEERVGSLSRAISSLAGELKRKGGRRATASEMMDLPGLYYDSTYLFLRSPISYNS